MQPPQKRTSPGLLVLLLVLSLALVAILFQRGLLLAFVGAFSVLIWLWLILLVLFLALFLSSVLGLDGARRFASGLGLSFLFNAMWFAWVYLLVTVLVGANVFVPLLPYGSAAGTGPASASGPASTAPRTTALKLQMTIVSYPAKIDPTQAPKLKVQVKNLSTVTSLTYQDIKNNSYNFNLMMKGKTATDGDSYIAQSYSYFAALPDERKLVVEDFGTLGPGQEKELSFTYRQLRVDKASFSPRPGSGVVHLGDDSNGNGLFLEPGAWLSCGSGLYYLTFESLPKLVTSSAGTLQRPGSFVNGPEYSQSKEIDMGKGC